MYFCHDFVLTDRTDAEMVLTFATDSSVIATKYVWNTVVRRETDKTKSTSLLPNLPCDVMVCCLYQPPAFHERYENGKKQAISRHYTEKQKLTPNYLHLCIRKKGERIKGKERERSQEIKTRREKKKEKETSLTSRRWSMHFSSEDQSKRQNTYQHMGKGRDVLWGTDKRHAYARHFWSASSVHK